MGTVQKLIPIVPDPLGSSVATQRLAHLLDNFRQDSGQRMGFRPKTRDHMFQHLPAFSRILTRSAMPPITEPNHRRVDRSIIVGLSLVVLSADEILRVRGPPDTVFYVVTIKLRELLGNLMVRLNRQKA